MAEVESLSMLVHGPSKAGKSLFSVSTPAPRVLFDVEAAYKFLPINYIIWDPKLPPPVADGTWDTAVIIVRRWADATAGLKWLQGGKHTFKSAGLDSVSELQARALEALVGREQVQIQDWGTVLRMLRGFIGDLRDLTSHPTNPLNAVVVTSMTKVGKDGRSYPWLQGQMSTVIPYLMDVIAYIDNVPNKQTGAEERFLYTRKTRTYLAGERVGGMIPAVLQMPVVTGNTKDEIAKSNIAYTALIDLVYKLHRQGIAPPAVVDTADSPHADRAVEQQEQNPIDADDVAPSKNPHNN